MDDYLQWQCQVQIARDVVCLVRVQSDIGFDGTLRRPSVHFKICCVMDLGGNPWHRAAKVLKTPIFGLIEAYIA